MTKDRWSLRNIYLYLVCLITLIMVIVASVGLVRAVVGMVYPEPAYSVSVPSKDSGMSEEDIKREQDYQQASQKRYAILDLVGNAAMLLIAGPLYIYHWRKIEVERPERTEIESAGV